MGHEIPIGLGLVGFLPGVARLRGIMIYFKSKVKVKKVLVDMSDSPRWLVEGGQGETVKEFYDKHMSVLRRHLLDESRIGKIQLENILLYEKTEVL